MLAVVRANPGLILTALGGVIGAWLTLAAFGDKGLGGASVIGAAIGSGSGLIVAIRLSRARG